MPLTKSRKISVVDSLKSRVLAAPSVVFVRFQNLSVAMATELRKALKLQQLGFQVVKKSLLGRALATKSELGTPPALEGAIAVAFGVGGDALAPAREVQKFVKKFPPETLRFAGGIYEGRLVDAALMTTLATIPDRPVLYGQLVGLLISPVRRLVVVLDQISKK